MHLEKCLRDGIQESSGKQMPLTLTGDSGIGKGKSVEEETERTREHSFTHSPNSESRENVVV